ncbi:MAG: hypothetical protein KF880_03765 [Ferruginibacter sp.]|nr:hypothetical protein [Ferruginibacter sp.]
MRTTFETEKNRKAFIYTVIICAVLLLLSILISWKSAPPPEPNPLDLIEINLGNDADGWGEEQPLVKGERGPSQDVDPGQSNVIAASRSEDRVTPDEHAADDAAPVNVPSKKPVNSKVESNVTKETVTTPKKAKVTYQGPGKGTGNNETEDNGYRYQGVNQGGQGDMGSPDGDKDSYGNTPGGAKGGPRVLSGNRKIVKYYSFTGELAKATIYAKIRVSPAGTGRFISFEKGSTSRSEDYAQAIRNYLTNIQFDKAASESDVIVQFNFNIN